MKFEEAIKLVKEVTGMSLDLDDAHYEALQMAIKTLEVPELTASEKKFLADIVNAYAGLVNIQIVKKIYDVTRDSYYLKFKTDDNDTDSSNTFSCFHGMFDELEEGKDYNIRKLLGKDC